MSDESEDLIEQAEAEEFMSRVMSNVDGQKDAEIARLRAALQEIASLGPLNNAPEIAHFALTSRE